MALQKECGYFTLVEGFHSRTEWTITQKRCKLQSKRVEDHSKKSCPSYGSWKSAFSLFYIKRDDNDNIRLHKQHWQQQIATTVIKTHFCLGDADCTKGDELIYLFIYVFANLCFHIVVLFFVLLLYEWDLYSTSWCFLETSILTQNPVVLMSS